MQNNCDAGIYLKNAANNRIGSNNLIYNNYDGIYLTRPWDYFKLCPHLQPVPCKVISLSITLFMQILIQEYMETDLFGQINS